MKTLVHYKKQLLIDLIQKHSALNDLYIQRSFSLDTQLTILLQDSEKFFEQLGITIKASEISALHVYVETALKGINPQTLEKLKLNKRNNIWISTFHVLSELGILLRDSLYETEIQIQEASALIEQLVLSAIQSHLIDDNTLLKMKDLNQIKLLWEQLIQNEQILLIERKLKLSVTQEDIFILLDKTFNKMNT